MVTLWPVAVNRALLCVMVGISTLSHSGNSFQLLPANAKGRPPIPFRKAGCRRRNNCVLGPVATVGSRGDHAGSRVANEEADKKAFPFTVRVANGEDRDFVYVELNRRSKAPCVSHPTVLSVNCLPFVCIRHHRYYEWTTEP